MGPRSFALYSYEDPWRASAFFSAFTQLLLTVLVLVHTVILCITFQLMKWYGWGYLSCHNGVYQRDAIQRFASGVVKKPFNLNSSPSRSSPLVNTEKFLKRTRSEDFQAVKSRFLVCPKCHGSWSLKQGLSFRYDKDAISKLREKPAPSDAASSFNGNNSHAEAEVTSNPGRGAKVSVVDKIACYIDSSFESSGSTQKFLKRDCEGKAINALDEIGHGLRQLEIENSIEDHFDTFGGSVSCLNTPVHGLPRLAKEEAVEGLVLSEMLEEVGSSSKESVGIGLHRIPFKSADSEINLESSEATPHPHEEIPKVIADEFLSAVLRKNGDCKDYDGESVIKALKAAVLKERKKLCALYAELEVERISSETAANEAMSMISRLQEEKAALRMQAAHYRRIAEERAIYDEQAMQLLKEILIKREKENFLLEKEVKAMRTKICKVAGNFSKRRQGVGRRSIPLEGQGLLLLKNEDEVGGSHEFDTKRKESVENPPSSCLTEQKPLKRLKGNIDHENVVSQNIRFDSEKPLQSSAQSGVCVGIKLHHHELGHDCSWASRPNEGTGVLNDGLLMQDISKVFEDKHLLSHPVKLLDSFEDVDKSPKDLLVPSTLSTAASSVSELVDKSGECSKDEGEAVFLGNGGHLARDGFALRYPDKVTGSLAACAKQTQEVACMQFTEGVAKCDRREDLQQNMQALKVNKVSWSCPSSLNHRGSGFNNYEESDSSLLWSHVH